MQALSDIPALTNRDSLPHRSVPHIAAQKLLFGKQRSHAAHTLSDLGYLPGQPYWGHIPALPGQGQILCRHWYCLQLFPSNSFLYACAQRTTISIASAFVYLFISLSQFKKREDCGTAMPPVFSYMTGFSVVRRHSVSSGLQPFYCIYIGFFCCPPTLRPKVRHRFRILGASRTRGMTPSVHFYYMQNHRKSQHTALEFISFSRARR